MPDHVNASLNRILRSGEYVCRPARQIFVEHTFTNKQGQVTRQVTKADLDAIAATGNQNAVSTGDLAPIGLGHTYDDIQDEKGNVVRKFSEADQPKPIGYLHNYYVAQRSDGKFALYADEWIQKTLTDERGQSVDGIQYAETFPRRSPEYFPGKKWIDWLALLRRTPALNMGLDIYAYATLHPDKALYRQTGPGLGRSFAAVEDSRGKLRYAHEEESMDFPKPKEAPSTPPGPQASAANATQNLAASPPAAPAAAPPGSPAAPPDDRPPLEPSSDDPMQSPLHQQAAERYMAHCTGMHHSQVKPLLHHMHAMYSAQLGLPGDKMAPHVPPPAPAALPGAAPAAPSAPAAPAAAAPAVPPVTPPASPPSPSPHEKHNAPVAGPGVGPAFTPGSEEHKRMSAVQAGIEQHRFATEAEKDRYELQQLKERFAAMETDGKKARYERDLTALLGMGYEFTLSKEVARLEPLRYDDAACAAHIACIKENYQRAPVSDSYGFIQTADAPEVAGPEKQPTREEKNKAVKYSANHGCSFDEALVKIRGV